MALYKAKNGNKYSEETVMAAAEKAGISLDEFVNNKGLERIEDEVGAIDEQTNVPAIESTTDIIIDDTEPPKKKKKTTSATSKNIFGEAAMPDLIGIEKLRKAPAEKPKKPVFDFSAANNTITNSTNKLIQDLGGPEAPVSDRSVMFANIDAEALKKQEAEAEELKKQQIYLDKTRSYRDKLALEELSFNNPDNINYDIDKDSPTASAININKKINRLGLEAEEFGDKIIFRELGSTEGWGGTKNGTFFALSDIEGMNKFISENADKTYAKKVKEYSKKKYPDLWEKITPPVLSEEEKRNQATKELTDQFRTLSMSGPIDETVSGRAGTGPGKVTKLDFDNQEDYDLYKQWEKSKGAPIMLPQSRVDAWDKIRKEKFISKASTDYARNLDPSDRKNLQIFFQEKINDSKYAVDALSRDINDYKVKVKEFNKDAEEYKKAPTPEKYILLKNKSLQLIDEQNSIGNREKELQKVTDYTKGILAPALTSFSANYNRINQLQSQLKSALVDVSIAARDISSYGSAAILSYSPDSYGGKFSNFENVREKIIKDDKLGLFHTARELELQKQQYQRSIGVDEIKSFDDAGNWLMSTVVNALPSIGMAFTGPAALPLFFASGYGGKASQMLQEAENAKDRISENTYAINNTDDPLIKAQLQSQINADEELLNLPEYKKFLGKTVYGGAEVVFELLGTLKILEGVGTAAKMLPKKSLKEGLLWSGKNATKNFNREGLTELGTTVTDNFSDIYLLGENKNLFEGGLESYTQGGIAGVGFGGIDTYRVVKRAIASELADQKQNRRMQEIVNQISELTGIEGYKKDQSIPLPIQDSPTLQKLVSELVDESNGIENDIVNRLGIDLTLEQATQIGDVNRQIREINKDFTEAAKDPNLKPAQLKTLEGYYRNKFNELVKQRETLLNDQTVIEGNKAAIIDARFEFDLTEGYNRYNRRMQEISLGQVVGNFNNLNNITKDELLLNAKNELELEAGDNIENITKKEIQDRALSNYTIDHYTKAIKKGITNAEAFAKSKGIDIKITPFEGPNADENIIAAYNESDATKEQKQEFAKMIRSGRGVEGINTTVGGKDVALIHIKNSAENGRTGVGAHEVLHSAVRKAFKDQKAIDKAGEDLLSYLEQFNPDIYALVKQRVDSSYSLTEKKIVKTAEGLKEGELRLRNEKGEIQKNQKYYEEVLNALSDIASDGVALPKDSLNAIRNFINNALPKGFPKLKESDGSDIYQFVKDYNKEAHFGKEQPSNIISFSGKLIGGDQEERKVDSFSQTRSVLLKNQLEELKDNEGDYDPDDFDQQVKSLEGQIARAIEKEKAEVKPTIKKEVSEEDTVKEIINNEKGSISSDKVQKIYEEKGLSGADEIIKLFRPITKKIVDKRRDAPGFDRELLTDEIETGKGGILDLIQKYDPKQGTPLAAYINKYLPVRAIATSRRILDQDFKKDVTEEKGLMAAETVSETKEKPKYKNALESKVFTSEVLESANKKILSIMRTLKSRIDAPVTLNRTVTPLIAEIRDEVGKMLDIDIKTMLGGKKDGVLRKELLRNKRYILENMTTTWLMGKDGQGGIPQAIQKQIDGKWVNYPDWVGKKIDREKTTTDQAGRTSGAELVRRLPNVANNISDDVFLAQIIGPDGNPIRGRKESLSKAMAEEGAFDIINNDLENQGPIYEALATNQTRLGVEIMENFPVVFKKDSERGNVKLSVTFSNFTNPQKEYITKKSFEFAIELANINYGARPDQEEIYNALLKVYNNGTIPNEDLNKLAKDIQSYYTDNLAEPLKDVSADYLNTFIKYSLQRDSNKLDILVEQSNANASKLFTNENAIREALKYTSDFISYLGEKYKGNEEELSRKIIKLGTFLASQAQIGDDSFTINEDNILIPKTPRVKEKDGEIIPLKVSYQLFPNKPAFWEFATIALGENAPKKFSRNRKGYVKDSAKDLFKNKSNKEYLENKKATEKENQDFLFELLNWYYNSDNKIPTTQKAMLWTSLNTNNESPLRKAGTATWIFDPDSGMSDYGELRYEHLKSVDKTRSELYNLFSNNTNLSEKEKRKLFDNIMKTYTVAVIPVKMDKIVTRKGFQREGIAGDISEGARYYNIATMGTDYLYSLKAIDPNAKIKTLGEEFVRISNALVESNKNNIRINAVERSLMSVTRKGISVFDFDDTVGITKSQVLYTMPDGSTGKLDGAEFAKQGAKLLEEGATFDFSEFSKVIDGKPGPMVDKMKKMIGKFGPENFFILTARPADSAEPIHQFLTSIGIDIPLENIIGLGNSTAQAKADWMTAKAADGYNDFYFADDQLPNVKAVKDALDVLDVKSKIQQARTNFSLTSKQDLKWKQGDEDLSTKFTVGNIDYRISMIETAYMEYDDDVQQTLFDLVKENNLDEDTTIAAYDGEAYNLEFWDKKQGNGITGTGNAAEVFGIVINGVIDRIKKKNIEALVFTAKEPSRIKLYNSMAEVVADKLGWGAYYKDGVYILSKKPKTIGSTTGVGSLKPVKDVLNVVDIKSPINQARTNFSRTISSEFNKIIEENTGMESYKVFSDIVARRRGKGKNKFDFYVPPSAADFELLLYNFIGKGERGEEQQEFFANALLKPYANGTDLMDAARQSIKRDYKELLKQFPDIKKELEKLTPDGDFTYDQAIRVAMWTEEEVEIPGISQRDQRKLTDLVNNDPELNAFKQALIVTGRQGKGWVKPTEYWDASTIISDLHNLTEGEGRKKFLGEFIENVEEMFGKFENGKLVGPNINKIEAVYGTNVREALEDQLYRMINGKNKSYGQDKETSRWSDWVNGSTGAIMFLNTRSAALQLLGAVNFLNLRDNNPFAAAKAFANQKQYWEDFSRIWNSDKMKERRGGLKEDVAAAEIANAAAGAKNKVNAVISYLLKIGYTPTQLADSFAIASGGAPFYRNRIKTYLKEGQTQEEAEANAWSDFTKVSDETQQSGDPRDISKQQASPAGRLLLTFQNFSMQQARIVKKSFLDLKNGRGDAKTHVAKIVYYLTIQNTLFAVLQQGLFAVLFDEDDEDKDKDKKVIAKKKTTTEKAIGVADDVLDTILRGTGFLGGIVSVLKNMYLKYRDESEKDFKADYTKVVLEGANISPPIGSKLRKLYSGFQQTKFERDLIKERGWGVMQDGRVHLGPMYGVTGKLVESTTNVPMDRVVNKIENVSQALNSQNKAWQRIMVGIGFTPYSVGIGESKGDQEIRTKAKEERKEAGKAKRKEAAQRERDSIANLSPDAYLDFVRKRKEARERKKDSIANLPPAEKEAYLKKKEAESKARKREKEALNKIKADSIASLSPEEKAKYDKKVAEEKAEKKKERREKYLEKKKALEDSLAKLSPREREKYKAKKKAERHEYYMKNKKSSKKKTKQYDIFI